MIWQKEEYNQVKNWEGTKNKKEYLKKGINYKHIE